MKGCFYNSKQSLCSIWESGKMCYDALKNSENYSLDYSEDTNLNFSYDFAIFNHHFTVNNWMSSDIIKCFNKPTFCIVTEVSFSNNPIGASPNYFDHYIVLDPTITETNRIHSFGRPLEDFDVSHNHDSSMNIPKIFSFGFATYGKEWHKIVEAVQHDYDYADIHFNIPQGIDLDVIGLIYKENPDVRIADSFGIEHPSMEPVDGFHANIRGSLTEEQQAALPLISAPATPHRVWA